MLAASRVADEYHLNKTHFLATLNCESGFMFDAVGDDGISIGVAQINLSAHTEVFYVQAMDPEWSLRWMAQAWRDGHAALWSCWRNHALY